MSSIELLPARNTAFLDRVLEVAQVAVGSILFCSVSIAGVTAVAWVIAVAGGSEHSVVAAAALVMHYARIPFEVAGGLSIFFAAVSWDSSHRKPKRLEESIDRRLAAIEQRLGIEHIRDIS